MIQAAKALVVNFCLLPFASCLSRSAIFDSLRTEVVRYGAGCPNTGYEVEHQGKPFGGALRGGLS
ncbi:hypothetical protein [Moorena sp. SIOASIH]|uniref:hypothetical protein n=1 Tax=Moorena sp. SIOASIH TaxID=2607817 RepID=UPI0025D15380|nr:hypothetical protein [Moorena sp. SIOASIH]